MSVAPVPREEGTQIWGPGSQTWLRRGWTSRPEGEDSGPS